MKKRSEFRARVELARAETRCGMELAESIFRAGFNPDELSDVIRELQTKFDNAQILDALRNRFLGDVE